MPTQPTIKPLTTFPALAIDLGTNAGVAWVESHGGPIQVKAPYFPASSDHGERYFRLLQLIGDMLGPLSNIRWVFVEDVLFIPKSREAVRVHFGMRGVLEAECFKAGVRLIPIPTGTIKTVATGKGNADKREMTAAAIREWPDIRVENDDIADALWIMRCGMLWASGALEVKSPKERAAARAEKRAAKKRQIELKMG